MRLLFTITLLVLTSIQLKAQTKLAIIGGFNYSTARAYFNGVKQPTGYVAGGNFGIQLKAEFDGLLHFSPYIGYSSRGYIIKSKINSDKVQNFIHYVDLAPVLSLDIPAGGKNTFVISAGPLAGLALAGTEKRTVSGVTTSSKMAFSTEKDYGRFDLGLHTSLGYHFNKLFVEIAYQYGFACINNEEQTDKRNIRNRTFSLNIGYYIKSFR